MSRRIAVRLLHAVMFVVLAVAGITLAASGYDGHGVACLVAAAALAVTVE